MIPNWALKLFIILLLPFLFNQVSSFRLEWLLYHLLFVNILFNILRLGIFIIFLFLEPFFWQALDIFLNDWCLLLLYSSIDIHFFLLITCSLRNWIMSTLFWMFEDLIHTENNGHYDD